MSSIIALQSLAWFFERLKERRLTLSAAGLVFAIIIMATRLILGAHYLSDISAGALISAVLALIYTIVQEHISGKEKAQISP